MSRLWALTCIVLALGMGLIAGILAVMVVFVLPRSNDAQSKFLEEFPIQKMLEAASPKDTQWTLIDNGTEFSGFSDGAPMGRRWLAECKMPNPADQAVVTSKLTIEMQSMTVKTYGGEIGVAVPPTAGPAGSTTPLGAGGTSLLDQTTLPYSVKRHIGCVHITVFGQGDRVAVSVIVQEH